MKIGHIDLGERPIFLAPMEDVTDPAFRLMCKKFGADMVYTEFVSADALIRSVSKTEQKLNISDEELDQMLQDRTTAAGYDTIEEYIGETSKEDYREYFLYDKVTDYLVENAKITNN